VCPLQVRGLKRTDLILPELYPSFTLLRQAIGAVKLGQEALNLLVPEVGRGGGLLKLGNSNELGSGSSGGRGGGGGHGRDSSRGSRGSACAWVPVWWRCKGTLAGRVQARLHSSKLVCQALSPLLTTTACSCDRSVTKCT
jgi:hypothetical protein